MDFKVTSTEQKLLITLSNRLPFEIVSMISTGVLSIETDADLKQIQGAAKLRWGMLVALQNRKQAQDYLTLAKRVRDMRNELINSQINYDQDLT